ncbi:hypothetical protein LguiB_021089 [Lonicera macranthoides]
MVARAMSTPSCGGMVARAMSTPSCGGMVAQRGHPTPEVGGSLETHIIPIGPFVTHPLMFLSESRSKSEFVLENETTKTREEDRLLRRRKQNIKGDDPATLSLDSDSTHNKQGYLSVIFLPFLLNLGFMSATAFFVMHVQFLVNLLELIYGFGLIGGNLIVAISYLTILVGSTIVQCAVVYLADPG